MEALFRKSTTRSLLEHFSDIRDFRDPRRIMYPLPEVLLLTVCATIADCDDYEDIVGWGEAHLDFLRRFGEFYWGVPNEDWLRTLMNRIDPDLFSACFTNWVREWFGPQADMIAIDGKTSRGSCDAAKGLAPLHLVSAFATTQRLVLGSQAVADKASEHTAIPVLLEKLALEGALVTIDALGCTPAIAEKIVAEGGDYLLAVKGNQASLLNDLETYFNDEGIIREDDTQSCTTVNKGHGRIETRRHIVSANVDWLVQARAEDGNRPFEKLTSIAMVESTLESKAKTRTTRRYYISSARLSAERFAESVRNHWGIENSLHWVLDVIFKEDQSRIRKGHGAKNMALVRHFAINLVRTAKDKKSIKSRRKQAGWNPDYLISILNPIIN